MHGHMNVKKKGARLRGLSLGPWNGSDDRDTWGFRTDLNPPPPFMIGIGVVMKSF